MTTTKTPIPAYGALVFHWSGRGWAISLYLWRRGPWRLSGYAAGMHWSLESDRWRRSLLHRTVSDLAWGFWLQKQRGVE